MASGSRKGETPGFLRKREVIQVAIQRAAYGRLALPQLEAGEIDLETKVGQIQQEFLA